MKLEAANKPIDNTTTSGRSVLPTFPLLPAARVPDGLAGLDVAVFAAGLIVLRSFGASILLEAALALAYTM